MLILLSCAQSRTQTVLSLSSQTKKIVVDDFSQFLNNPLLLSATTLTIDHTNPPAPALAVNWDLVAESSSFVDATYSTQGSFDEEDINIRVVNECNTPDIDYAGTGFTPNNNHLSSTVFREVGPVGQENFIVGDINVNNAQNGAPLSACSGDIINGEGNTLSNPRSHSFRVDIELDFSAFPTTIVKPGFYTYTIMFKAYDDASGALIGNTESFELEIEILPILQLNFASLSEIDFDFTNMVDYRSGIINYSKTRLQINSNLEWDLFAVASSSINENSNGTTPYWDNLSTYGTFSGGSLEIPLSALELFQTPQNPIDNPNDYNASFTDPPSGNNNIEVATGLSALTPAPGTGSTRRSIAGKWEGVNGNAMSPGSYIIADPNWNKDDFSYSISYKLTPGVPAIFNNGLPSLLPKGYAAPGAYTMRIKYVLSEDQ